MRLDGYHILADLTGVPDLFARIKPTLVSLNPVRDTDKRVTALKPWVRVVTMWVAVVPLLLLSLVFAVINLSRVAATAWDSAGLQRQALSAGWGDGDVLAVLASVLSMLALCLPVFSTVCMLGRTGQPDRPRPVAQGRRSPGAADCAGLRRDRAPRGLGLRAVAERRVPAVAARGAGPDPGLRASRAVRAVGPAESHRGAAARTCGRAVP